MQMTKTIQRFVLALAVMLYAWHAAGQTMRVHVIDVGQGAATLVEFPCAAVLIDVGGEKNAQFDGSALLTDYLDDFFERRTDLQRTLHGLYLTHPHKDHTLSTRAVLRQYRVLNGVTNGMETGSGRHGQISLHKLAVAAEEGGTPMGFEAVWVRDIAPTGKQGPVIDPVACPDIDPRITALWGQVDVMPDWSATVLENGNNHSLVLRVDFGKASLLVAGDLEREGIAALLNRYRGTGLLDVDLVTVNHHGSANGTTSAFLDATSPRIAVIQAGEETREVPWSAWAYGHPRRSVVEVLERHVQDRRPPVTVRVADRVRSFTPLTVRRAVYATGWDGNIVLEAKADGRWSAASELRQADKVDLNHATFEQLVGLPMIGAKRAAAILQLRAQQPLRSVEDLKLIPGIKDGTVSALRHLVIP
jgi:competence protein ComEC